MAGNANQKIQSAGGASPLDDCFEWQGFFSEVHPRGVRGQCDIQPVIDENARGGARFGNRETCEFRKRARVEILLANLNPAGTGRSRAPDGIVKRLPAKRLAIARQ